MNIIRADHYGMCFGVKNAIALAKRISGESELTILGELVHNDFVLNELRRRGIQFANEVHEIKTKKVMITAHGASDCVINRLKDGGFDVVEATCPLVKYAHKAVKKFVEEGFFPVVVGKPEHVEVRGIVGDLGEYAVILTREDVDNLPQKKKYGVLSQTTQPVSRVLELIGLIRERFSGAEIRFVDTVCAPTKQRQIAAVEIAKRSDVVVVVGGKKSNNTAELTRTCLKFCKHVYQVETATDLVLDWFNGVCTVGITAGTSTPDEVVDDVERTIAHFSFLCEGVKTAAIA
ncbi:MAG: 4-hydroxy-3-methylbut-2-enyl diphosphate reductase [Verrucomicrobiae bacterium]|nr:4-hydroxy-3-methylbut-2-enyl diphosphate reductase [Verrucomicrobiae bacterium]